MLSVKYYYELYGVDEDGCEFKKIFFSLRAAYDEVKKHTDILNVEELSDMSLGINFGLPETNNVKKYFIAKCRQRT